MITKIKSIIQEAEEKVISGESLKVLDEIRIQYFGRKGKITQILKSLKDYPPQIRADIGKEVNEFKNRFFSLLEERKKNLEKEKLHIKLDVSLPGILPRIGRKHPLNIIINEICKIFHHLGFTIVEGPEIETDYYNFQALNIPQGHPARESFATFYLPFKNYLLRSQTSPVQIRIMKEVQPPLRVIAPGKVFRPDAVDASHSFMFHQIEGLAVDEETNFSHLKASLLYFAKALFGKDTKVRFRPHYFPFTEPSAELDINCIICGGEGCSVCGHKGWLEILGCGMVHPNVFREVGYDYKKIQGYAFGMGVERIAMLKYGIDDIRLFFNNDLRFLEQFR
jgi:phenylalanyl-tRNA synthetase alpha chain